MERWISILDEEPKAGQGVLIAISNGLITIGYRKIKKNSHDWQIFGSLEFLGLCQDDYVTHWMELPELPKIPYIKNGNLPEWKVKKMYQLPVHRRDEA